MLMNVIENAHFSVFLPKYVNYTVRSMQRDSCSIRSVFLLNLEVTLNKFTHKFV